uniref:Eukaryotic translation initiation factor 2 alpha kinase 2 n=1 Tax=Varanus komodoensis TaxID=61221 RepID=A0A8D2JHD7_VARKO
MANNHADSIESMRKLNEYCQRNGLQLNYRDIAASGPSHDPEFTIAVFVGTQEYARATGKSKKEAKHAAAHSAWAIIQCNLSLGQRPPPPQLLPPSPPQLPKSASLSSELPCSPGNHISWLNEFAQKNGVNVVFISRGKTGEAHKPNFFQECTINGKVFGSGSGNSKQTANKNAAKQAYENLMSRTGGSALSTSSSARSSFLDSEDTSNGVSEKSAEEDSRSSSSKSDLSSSKSNSIVFQSSGVFSDIDSHGENACNRLSDQLGAVCLSDSLTNSRGHAMQPKRKEMLLAPAFSKPLLERGKVHTTNRRFLEDFEIIQRIGKGGYGHVFKAKHRVDKTLYAVKRVKIGKIESEKEASRKEVVVLTKLKHDNIVQYHSCWIGEDDYAAKNNQSANRQYLFIQMQYCEKGTLENWIENESGKESSRNDALIKFQQILEGVNYIHMSNFIHRDLKPSNIFISSDDKIKIGDFGLVTSGANDPLTERTAGIGTASYRPPEQEKNNYGKEVDIFPLGLILLEMLYPFETRHEKIEEWQNIRKGELPEKFSEKFPEEVVVGRKTNVLGP